MAVGTGGWPFGTERPSATSTPVERDRQGQLFAEEVAHTRRVLDGEDGRRSRRAADHGRDGEDGRPTESRAPPERRPPSRAESRRDRAAQPDPRPETRAAPEPETEPRSEDLGAEIGARALPHLPPPAPAARAEAAAPANPAGAELAGDAAGVPAALVLPASTAPGADGARRADPLPAPAARAPVPAAGANAVGANADRPGDSGLRREVAAAPRAAERHESRRADAADERAANVLRQIRLAIHPGLRQAVIELRPPELGRVAIRISVRGGRVSGVVRAESEETRALLERHVPELRAALARQGLDTGELSLELGLGTPARTPIDERGSPRRPAPPAAPSGDDTRPSPRGLPRATRGVADDRIDTYA